VTGESHVSSENGVLDESEMITRREAVLRVTAMLGGVALIGGSAFITGCRAENVGTTAAAGADSTYTPDYIAFLDEVAETILPATSTPGAKAAKTGAFMAMMVRDSYYPKDRKIFRDGMGKIDEATQKAYKTTFMKATPEQRLAVLTDLDKERKAIDDARSEARKKRTLANLTDQKQANTQGAQTGPAEAATEDPPNHYFRMMKELALLGYFTSEIGMTQAQQYVEAPGHYDPCAPYKPGEKSWASHA
jgi:glucoside 3-dehydrogenase (cytochrome c) hitch-hiker subunit